MKTYYLELRLQYDKKPKKCAYCKTKLPFEKKRQKFCSQKCNAGRRTVKRQKCLNCENLVSLPKHKYCSLKCDLETRQRKIESDIEKNINRGISSQAHKKYLLKYRGRKCQICKRTKWQNKPIPLIMDHIDGNSENSDLSNLRLVCGNCDMQLPTSRGKNRGKGREWRRQRYLKGKSFKNADVV